MIHPSGSLRERALPTVGHRWTGSTSILRLRNELEAAVLDAGSESHLHRDYGAAPSASTAWCILRATLAISSGAQPIDTTSKDP